MTGGRDHGGGIDAAAMRYGGYRSDWLDLSTGINPVPYPIGEPLPDDWTALPDAAATSDLIDAMRQAWRVPDKALIVPAPGASAIIARMPDLSDARPAWIPGPTYNEHAAAFVAREGASAVSETDAGALHVYVHPNNPDGRFWPIDAGAGATLTVIDESFCDICPDKSQIDRAATPGTIILKSFGKFWGLAGLRLGAAIGHPDTLAPAGRASLHDLLGPWAVSGPALRIATRALRDMAWADETRKRLLADTARLDGLMTSAGATIVGGTPLFRLYKVDDAQTWQDRLARHHIWSRVFPYAADWLRLGLPAPDRWEQLEKALQ